MLRCGLSLRTFAATAKSIDGRIHSCEQTGLVQVQQRKFGDEAALPGPTTRWRRTGGIQIAHLLQLISISRRGTSRQFALANPMTSIDFAFGKYRAFPRIFHFN
jgi:hypothetical protein